jgi:galactokinase
MKQFFCPGRTELAGNHTDHHKGRAIAAGVDKGITAQAEPNGERVIRIRSQGFAPLVVELDKLWPDEKEVGTSAALVRGMASVLQEQGQTLTGFDAYVVSDLKPGGGLASSAAFSVLVGAMITAFAQDSPPVTAEELACAAQKAENRWFGKPCGLMDPMACALGGCIYMDFWEDRILPIVCDFDGLGLTLCLTDTGSSHVQATADYAQIAAHMTDVAQVFGQPCLGAVRPADFDKVWPEHDQELPWRRARHFFDENWRVSAMADALGLRDGQRYCQLMNQSGRSSETLLENIQTPTSGQALAQGLALSQSLLEHSGGAWRVHGGGFGGCVQALMPAERFPAYQAAMEYVFGLGSCQKLSIVSEGVVMLP